MTGAHLLPDAAARRSRRLRRRLALLPAVGLALAAGMAARAQTAPAQTAPAQAAPAQAAPGAEGLEEVVVTAEKRQSTIQGTPISITAVTGDDLERQGVASVATLAAGTPGVSIESVGPGRTNFDIRGLSNTGGSSPTVGFYLDEVPVTPPSSTLAAAGKTEIDPDLYDLARVEVLRGPQGTLYGASSMGGTIRLITNQPKLDVFEGSGESIVSGTEGGGLNYTQNAMVNVPLVDDRLALRMTATEKYEDGFIDRIVVNDFPPYTGPNDLQRGNLLDAPVAKRYANVNDDRVQALRGTVLWQPIDHLTITPSIFVQKITQNGQNSYDLPPGTLAHYQPGDMGEDFEQDFSLYAVTVKYDADAFTVQSTTSELHGGMYNTEDTQEQWYGLTLGLPTAPFFPTPGSAEEDHKQRQFSEELRAASNGSGPLQWIAGGFYSDYKDILHYYEYDQAFVPLYGTSLGFADREPDHLQQEALFGEVTYEILPQVKLNAGLRYFHYRFDFEQHIAGIVTGPPYDFAGGAGASGFNPKFNIDWTPSEDLTLYATAAKGFRPGGPNLPVPTAFCASALAGLGLTAAPESYQPDSVWSYEVGEKAKLLDGTLAVRGSLYYIDWSQIQQQVQLSCGYNFNANAGSADSKGGEVEVDYRVMPGLTLHQSLGYTKAEITSSSFGAALPVGAQLQDVPQWTIGSALDYATPINDDWTATARLDDRFVGRVNDLSALPYPITTRPAYNIIDLRFGAESDAVAAYLFVDNLLDRRAIMGFDHSEAQNTPQFARLIPNRPRTIGIDLQYRF